MTCLLCGDHILGEQNRERHLGQEGHMHRSGGGKEPSCRPVRVELRVQEQSEQAGARFMGWACRLWLCPNNGPRSTCESQDSKGSRYL